MSDTTEMVIASDRATVVMRVVTADYGVVVVLEPGGSLGRARYEMHKASLALVDELAA